MITIFHLEGRHRCMGQESGGGIGVWTRGCVVGG